MGRALRRSFDRLWVTNPRPFPACCLRPEVLPARRSVSVAAKFQATEEDSLLNLRLPVRLPTSLGCRFPQLLTKRLLELALRAWTEEREDGLGA